MDAPARQEVRELTAPLAGRPRHREGGLRLQEFRARHVPAVRGRHLKPQAVEQREAIGPGRIAGRKEEPKRTTPGQMRLPYQVMASA